MNLKKLKVQFSKQTKNLNLFIDKNNKLDTDLKLYKLKLNILNKELNKTHENNIKTLKRSRYKYILYGAGGMVLIKLILKFIF